jgi:hypothetical protein
MDLASAVRSEHTRARVTVALLAAGLLLNLIAVGSGLAQNQLLESVRGGAQITAERAEANDARQQLIGIVQILVFLATVVSWLMWQYRAYANLRLVGSRETELSPGWSVGYWFIPFINLVRPYQVTAEVWRRSELLNMRDPLGGLSGPPIILAWWLVYLVTGFLGRAFMSMSRSAKSVPELITATNVGILGDAVGVVSCVLALVVVLGIDRFQQKFVAAASTAAMPPPAVP